MNGTFGVESALGHGSKFWFERMLPTLASDRRAKTRGTPLDESSAILLVEDNPDDAELLIYAFGKVGIANPVVLVDDGEKAMNYIHGRADYADRAEFPVPGMILLDLKLPRYSGFEVLEVIRPGNATRRTPVVVLTSSNQEEDIRHAYDLGANACLVKPVGGDALTAMMRSVRTFWLQLNRAATS